MNEIKSPGGASRRLAYKLNEVAQILGVSHSTVRRAIARGDIRPLRAFRHILVSTAELERFVADKSARAGLIPTASPKVLP